MKQKVGIVDCNNFYVSCERVFNPESIGRPTIVLSNNDGCVIARSQEAKDLGVKMGEPFFKNREEYDKLNFCVYSSNYNLYGDMSDRVMSILKRHGFDIEVYSIDEAFVDFSLIPDDELITKLQLIKKEIYNKVGIPVSIGVGPNKTLAKLTSHIAKKKPNYDGVCSYWELIDYRNYLYQISVDDVWGIGNKWAKKLKGIGVESVGQFVNLHDGIIKKLMNINGLRTKHELLGLYCFVIQKTFKTKKNVASTRSFGNDVEDFSQLAEAMYTYIENGVRKINSNQLDVSKVTIFISGNHHKGDNHHYTKSFSLQKQTNDVSEIWSQVYPHLRNIFKKEKKYKKCGIIFNDLTPSTTKQSTLFIRDVQVVSKPINIEKKWETKKEYITKSYTTSWDDIPKVFI